MFFLLVRPEPPTNFEQIRYLVTDNSFTVRWTPGLDGGYPQTFILRYMTSSESEWTEVSIPGQDDEPMNYTLTNLESSTEYRVKIHSRNKLGESVYSDTLHIRTKGTFSIVVFKNKIISSDK